MTKLWYALSFCCLLAAVGAFAVVDDGGPKNAPGPGVVCLALFCFFLRKAVKSSGKKLPPVNKLKDTLKQKTTFKKNIVRESSDTPLAECHKEIFYSTLETVQGIWPSEIDKIYMLAALSRGAEPNIAARSDDRLYKAFFAGRDWQWPEFEDFRNFCRSIDAYPKGAPVEPYLPPADCLRPHELFELLDENRLRKALEQLGYNPLPRSSKAELAASLSRRITPDRLRALFPKIDGRIAEYEEKRKKAIFDAMLRTINSRADALLEQRYGTEPGPVLHDPANEVFVNYALGRNPQALPPLFPGDVKVAGAVTGK